MEARWRKSSSSEGMNNCVEVAHVGAVRDSKNPGVTVHVDLDTLLAAVRAGRLDR